MDASSALSWSTLTGSVGSFQLPFQTERIDYMHSSCLYAQWTGKDGEHDLLLRVWEPQAPQKCPLEAGVVPPGVGYE